MDEANFHGSLLYSTGHQSCYDVAVVSQVNPLSDFDARIGGLPVNDRSHIKRIHVHHI